MKRRVFTLVMAYMLATAAGCGFAKEGTGQQSSAQVKELTQDIGVGINIDYSKPSMQPVCQFGYELLEQNLEESNPVLSPVSAYVTLCMIGNGAKGETEEEFRKVLGGDMMCIPDDLMNTLPQNQREMQLSIASSTWIDETFTAKDEWLGKVKSLFDASVYQADLENENTVEEINKWVCENTKQKIPELLDHPFEENSELILLNALYFQADWEHKFEAENTMDWRFVLDHHDEQDAFTEASGNASTDEDGIDENTIKVPMMHTVIDDGRYIKDDRAEGVILPYANSRFAFVAVRPLGEENIREWYSSYDAQMLQNLISDSRNTKISLGLPKFSVGCKKTLNDSLKNMGIQLAFDTNLADLTLLGETQSGENLYLGRVLQEAVLEVAEEGTQAAAATMAEVLSGGAMPEDLQIVQFDRSFFYMIIDTETGAPIFMGILDKP